MQKQQARATPGAPEFDGIANIGNESGTVEAKLVFRGLLQCAPDREIVFTFPAVTELLEASPVTPCAGYCKRFSIRNDGRAAATVVPGKGGSINGSATVSASSYAAHYVLRFTNVSSGNESYQIIRE